MLRRTQQVMLNDAAAVESWVRSALALVEKVEPPDDLRAAVFTAAVNLLAASHSQLEEVGAAQVFSRPLG